MNKLIILIFLLTASQASADIWDAPTTKYFYSENKTFMLKIVPTDFPQNYSKAKFKRLKKRNKITDKDTTFRPCIGILYKINGSDTVTVWEKRLVNLISPVSALIADDGKSVITFDNWGFVGLGPNVMVVYNELGDVQKSYKLVDISPFPLEEYPKSISSIYWSWKRRYLNKDNIEICFENTKGEKKLRIYNLKRLEFD